MQVHGEHKRTIWLEPDGWAVGVIDQTLLPHRYATVRWETVDDAAVTVQPASELRKRLLSNCQC